MNDSREPCAGEPRCSGRSTTAADTSRTRHSVSGVGQARPTDRPGPQPVVVITRRGESIASNRERERTGGEFAAAPSVAEHGCLVGVELTALCRALGGRWRGFGALTHGRPRAGPLARLWRGGLPHKRRRSWRMRGPRRAAGTSREANFNTIPATVCRPGK